MTTTFALDLHLQLVEACVSGDLSKLTSLVSIQETDCVNLIKGNVSHGHKSKYGKYSPGDYVYVASEYGFPTIVHYLMQLGADGNALCISASPPLTPMSIACHKGHTKVIKELHANGIELHPTDNFKDSPIYYCARYGKLDILKYIVENERGILIKTTGDIGTCPQIEYTHIWASLTRTAQSDDTIVIGNLLLYVACIQRHLDIVKYLVSKGVSVQTFLPKVPFTFADALNPLSAACKNEDEDMATFLLENQAEFTESVAEFYPDFTGKILNRNIANYRRSKSVSKNSVKNYNPPKSAIAIYWDSKGLIKLHQSWIEPDASRIFRVDIHDNKLTCLPPDFFKLLVNLEELDMSSNQLTSLPSEHLDTTRLVKIIACNNKLTNLPIELFMNRTLHRIDVSSNNIASLPSDSNSDETWNCPSLKYLRCSNNMIENVPKAIEGAQNLEKLYLNKNRLESFDIVWKCPLVDLDLGWNSLKQFSGKYYIEWSKTLCRLNLSHNNLNSISSNICKLENLQELNVSYNCLRTLPPPRNWLTKILSKLDLSHNMLYTSVGPSGTGEVNINDVYSDTCEFPDDLFENCLQILDLSHNKLEIVPPSLCRLKSLLELQIGDNPMTSLPVELGRLKNIWNLQLTNLKIPDLPIQLDDKNHAKTVLPILRAKLRKSEPFNRMKLMVVGLQESGKTTLIATLQGKRPPPNVATNGVKVEQWRLSRKSATLPFFRIPLSDGDITFSSWDLAGQHVYYATHQCFLTGKTLYLVVFNTTLGTDGVDNLESWLLNIQVRAPDSKVIIVGTHIDLLPGVRKTVLDDLKERIIRKYNKKGFPKLCDIAFVSNPKMEGLQVLRDVIINVATRIIEDESYGGNVGAGRTAPHSYIQLYQSVVKESERRKREQLLPILTTQEMLDLAGSNPDNDIIDVEELFEAAAFLHENGILLHFNDHLRELNTSFFIDPSWLCDMLALVVTVKQRNPYVQGGYISREDLIKSAGLPEEFIPQYLQLLERFEIVLSLNENTLLIPCMLPKERPSVLTEKEKLVNRQDHCITRNYHMSYIPAGFWSRLIARIIIAVHKWGMLLDTTSDDVDDDDNNNNLDKYSTMFWREGIIVCYSKGCFLVEYFEDEVSHERIHNKGVTICIWSQDHDFSTMGFIVDHLDSLITEWYPGLDFLDEYGVAAVQKLIPCPSCCTSLKRKTIQPGARFNFIQGFNADFRNPNLVRQFDLTVCAIAAANYMAISCHRHTDEVVPLNLVVPDLLLSDLPSHYVIDQDMFEFEPCDETQLGAGGAGGVYQGKYKGQNVAVKQFHSSHQSFGFNKEKKNKKAQSVFVPPEQTDDEKLLDTKVVKTFWDLRQEVAVLCRLEHPNIVKVIGVSHSPLCFVLELAPLGSLWSVLTEVTERVKVNTDTQYKGSVLGPTMTHKIALQVSHALEYLHESKIIYRDLKSDNILVWSLSEDADINVKLSDYGISAFATPQGVIGESGTPGFQAPEIKRACPYDAKVDVFSFGMWLYEVISGNHPFQMYRSGAEIKKAVTRGQRPDLRSEGINPGMPYLELLMKDCWQEYSRYRPTSSEIVSRLQCVEMGIVRSVFPMHDAHTLNVVSCIVPLSHLHQGSDSANTVLVWCDKNDGRRYKVIKLLEEQPDIDIPSPGPRVSCAVCVGNLLWLGTEGQLIEVMTIATLRSSKDRKLSLLWTIDLDDHCIDLLLYENKDSELVCIFASLANGMLMVFKKTEVDHDHYAKCEESGSIRECWSSSQVLSSVTPSRSAKCLCLTRDESELWVSAGNVIVIIKPETLEVTERFEGARYIINSMVTDNKYVWISERNMRSIIQFDVETRTKLHKFGLNADNIVNSNIFSIPHEDSIDEGGDVVVGTSSPHMRRRGDNISFESESSPMTKTRAVSDVSLSGGLLDNIAESNNKDESNGLNSNKLMKASLCKQPSLSSIQVENMERNFRQGSVSVQARTVIKNVAKIRSLLYHDGRLYVGRSSGDIVIIDINSVASNNVPESESFGKVIAQLGGSMGYENHQRTVTCLLHIGENKILSSVRIEPLRSSSTHRDPDSYQLLMFEVWNTDQLQRFYDNVFNDGRKNN